MQKDDRIRAACIFQMVNCSPTTTAIFSDLLVAEGLEPAFVNQFAESSNTIGLIHYHDGTEKPAWDEFIKWLEVFD